MEPSFDDISVGCGIIILTMFIIGGLLAAAVLIAAVTA